MAVVIKLTLMTAAYSNTTPKITVITMAHIIKYPQEREEHTDMVSMEKKKMIEKINDYLRQRFQVKSINKHDCFINTNNVPFFLSEFPGENAIVVEYVDNNNVSEDGDVFYLEEYRCFNDLLDAIRNEISQAD